MSIVLLALTLPTLATARTWHVPGDAPTIQAGIDSASIGDDVLVAPGTYVEHDIAVKAGITVHSEQGADVTTIDASGAGTGFVCSNLDETATIEGFTLVHGHALGPEGQARNGGGIRALNSSLLLRDCMILECSADSDGGGIFSYLGESLEIEGCTVVDCSADERGGGVCALGWDSGESVRITNSKVVDNQATSSGGILAWAPDVSIGGCVVSGNSAGWGAPGGIGCVSEMLTIWDCVIVGNQAVPYEIAGGLVIDDSRGTVSGCTVAENEGSYYGSGGIEIRDSDVTIERTISAFNTGSGLECWTADVNVRCCDLYGNTGGDDLCGTDLGGNFSADPLFCDAAHNDYTLDGCSPCLPGNHPDGVDCGLIGALGQGCGATAIEKTSWGRVKALYRK